MPLLSLLQDDGQIHQTAGLNWGSNSNNHTRRYDAYIPIKAADIRRNPDYYPPKQDLQSINLIWDDGVVMTGLLEGTYNDPNDGLEYPKQISSHPHKDTLGRYFRGRLGIIGNRPISKQDLINYGRTNVEITRIDETNYHLNFSI